MPWLDAEGAAPPRSSPGWSASSSCSRTSASDPKHHDPADDRGPRPDDPGPRRAVRRPLEHVRRVRRSAPRRRSPGAQRTTRGSTSSAPRPAARSSARSCSATTPSSPRRRGARTRRSPTSSAAGSDAGFDELVFYYPPDTNMPEGDGRRPGVFERAFSAGRGRRDPQPSKAPPWRARSVPARCARRRPSAASRRRTTRKASQGIIIPS